MGEPMAIKLLIPDLPSANEVFPYLQRIDASRQYSNFGPLVRELEARLAITFAPGLDCEAITFSNCTDALVLWLNSLELPPGARVAVPALTFVATGLAILNAGLIPVLIDSDRHSWIATPDIAAQVARSGGFDAILAVATFGAAHDPLAWAAFALEHGIPVLIDAAGAIGNQVPAVGVDVAYSLHATKTLGAGEGGFILTTEPARAARLRQLTNFGIVPEEGSVFAGTNAKMSEYHAAVALAALDRWPQRSALRRQLSQRYIRRFDNKLVLQQKNPDDVYSLFVGLLPPGCEARQVRAALAGQGVETRSWYVPTLDQHPVFDGRFEAVHLPNTEFLRERLIGLPFHPFITDGELDYIESALREVLRG